MQLFPSRIAARMDALVHAYAKLGRFSGAVLVARGERALFKRGYGMASYEHAVPNTTQTRFRIGSQTKAFTAIAALQLQEQGRLGIQNPIAAYLPGYPHGDRMTIHHLLTNTAGIPDYVAADEFTRIMGLPHARDEVIALFRDRPLLFAPGERFSYSNAGWVLLGAIIEQAGGMTYGDYIRAHILAPAGMTPSGVEHGGDVIQGHAGGYLMREKQVVRAAYLDNSLQFAAGDLHASAEDMHRWVRGLAGGRLLRPESLALLRTPYVTTEHGDYGYGCVIGQAFGHRYVECSGGTLGFVSVTTHYPDDDIAIVVLSNFENAPFNTIERGLAAIVFGTPYELPTGRVFVAVDPARFAPYIGRYTMSFVGRTHVMEVSREGERLMVEVQGLPKTELRPLSMTRFFAQMKGEVELEFVTDGERPAQEIALTWAGHPNTARRVA